MPPTRPGDFILGDHKRTPDGKLVIRGSRLWVPYPPTATDLVTLAHEYGWGTDDGLPVRHTLNGDVFVRILVGRERGDNALFTGTISPGTQFHLGWRLNLDTWEVRQGYVKVGTYPGFRFNEWRETTAEFARKVIAGNPVTLPSPYADEKELSC